MDHAFEKLGDRVLELESEVAAQEAKLDSYADEFEGLEYRLGEAQDTISELEAEVTELESEVEALGEDGLRQRIEEQRQRFMLGLDQDMTVAEFIEVLSEFNR